MWISADPGCGKSVLAKALIDEDLWSPAPSAPNICYFFFKENEEQNSLATALCAILHQLFGNQPNLLHRAIDIWSSNRPTLQKEPETLWRIFQEVLDNTEARDTFCILDALDECREVDQARLITFILMFLNKRVESNGSKARVKFLITSRPYEDIEARFERGAESIPNIRLRGEDENETIREEIDLVIGVRMKELAKELNLRETFQKNLERQLLAMQHRTYLWLHLAIDDIRHMLKKSLRLEQETIRDVPHSVDAAYEKILQRVDDDQKADVKTIFSIVVAAHWPLTIKEMSVALGIATSTSQILGEVKLDEDRLTDRMRHWCGLFIFFSQSKIYLIHQTARDFLLQQNGKFLADDGSWRYSLVPTDVQTLMAEICIQFLQLEDFQDGFPLFPTRDQDFGSLQLERCYEVTPFLEYASRYWLYHLRESNLSPHSALLSKLMALYMSKEKLFAQVVGTLDYIGSWAGGLFSVADPYSMPRLSLAAANGHFQVAEKLIFTGDLPIDVDARDCTLRTPLIWASMSGAIQIVRLL